MWEHNNHLVPGFTSNYKIDRLVHYESTPSIQAAIRREKEIKGWSRAKKIALVAADNPWWDDLAEDWYD